MRRAWISVPLIGWMVLPWMGCVSSQGLSAPRMDDPEITARFKIELNKHAEINVHDLDIDAHDRIVTLSGIVETAGDKEALVRIARGIRGVREVIDNLVVRQ